MKRVMTGSGEKPKGMLVNSNAAHKVTSVLGMLGGEAAAVTPRVGNDIIMECEAFCSKLFANVGYG